jgi:tripartite-type tricarboxylate transporter receptor subunit TctC
MKRSRRKFLHLTAGAAALPVASRIARAQDYPSRPVRLMIGFPPGSAADITARLVGDAMSRTLGQPMIVEARSGAAGSLAAELVARAPADGYTLLTGASTLITNAVTGANLRFDFAKDLAPVTALTSLPSLLAVHPGLGVSSVKELVALAKSKPGELTYASVGPGSPSHLATELLALRTGIKLVHVPYQGTPQAITDLLGGRISMAMVVASTILPHAESGRLKALASTSGKRPDIAPNIPTMIEAGVPDFEFNAWFGLLAPAGTPRPVIDKLAAAANAALKSEEVVGKLKTSGFEPLGGGPDEFRQLMARDLVTWEAAAKAAGLKK